MHNTCLLPNSAVWERLLSPGHMSVAVVEKHFLQMFVRLVLQLFI